MVHALPFLLSRHIIKITGISARTLSRRNTHMRFRIMVEARLSAAPLKREEVEAQGRKNQLGKMIQLLEQLPPSSQSGDFREASSFHMGLFPWEPGAEECIDPQTSGSWRKSKTITFTELPGRDGV